MSPDRDSRSSEPDVLDVVELRAISGRWPIGTVGTVVERWTDRALVELADERGHALDLIELPLPVLRRIEASQQQHLPV